MNKAPSRIRPEIEYEQCVFVEDIGKKGVCGILVGMSNRLLYLV